MSRRYPLVVPGVYVLALVKKSATASEFAALFRIVEVRKTEGWLDVGDLVDVNLDPATGPGSAAIDDLVALLRGRTPPRLVAAVKVYRRPPLGRPFAHVDFDLV